VKYKFSSFLLRYRSWAIGTFQACLVVCALILSWLLRFDLTLPYRAVLVSSIPILVITRLATMSYFGLLRGWWSYVGIRDGLDILEAVGSGSVLFWITMHVALRTVGFPRTVYILEPLFTSGLLAGVRLLSRAFAESVREDISLCKKVVLIGAGSAARTILREINGPGTPFVAVGCLDDDPSKLGIRIENVRVLGTVDQLTEVLLSNPADEVLITIPSATSADMRRFVDVCTRAKIKFRTVPALKDIIVGDVAVSQLREVSLEDLLGREPIEIDLEAVRRQIEGRRILVTGAAGSIGSELCRQILDYDPSHLLCLDQNETGLFFLRLALMDCGGCAKVSFPVGDICDTDRLGALFAEARPEIVFHAAAYKHVPMMESNVREAVKNNVVALTNLLDLAQDAGCENFVLISSDKAVNPTNVMGATKRICELILSSRPANGMRCVSVRFGNVLGSSGSVVPILRQQLENHRPLTITHPETSRFFMLVPEAVALVLQAFAIGHHRDILVLDMGRSVRILDLARNLIRLSGKLEDDVEIRFTGLRKGEKLHEELFYGHERILQTPCNEVKRTCGTLKDWPRLRRQLRELSELITTGSAMALRAKIKEIVPEYCFHVDGLVDASPKRQTNSHRSAVAASD
jgi:FlaA1/EpsC-like NDP-sugar epimerase